MQEVCARGGQLYVAMTIEMKRMQLLQQDADRPEAQLLGQDVVAAMLAHHEPVPGIVAQESQVIHPGAHHEDGWRVHLRVMNEAGDGEGRHDLPTGILPVQ
jgi:hypothetical protein